MALITKTFKLELSPGGCPDTVITASQGDIGRPFEASPYDPDAIDLHLAHHLFNEGS